LSDCQSNFLEDVSSSNGDEDCHFIIKKLTRFSFPAHFIIHVLVGNWIVLVE